MIITFASIYLYVVLQPNIQTNTNSPRSDYILVLQNHFSLFKKRKKEKLNYTAKIHTNVENFSSNQIKLLKNKRQYTGCLSLIMQTSGDDRTPNNKNVPTYLQKFIFKSSQQYSRYRVLNLCKFNPCYLFVILRKQNELFNLCGLSIGNTLFYNFPM